MLAPDFPFSGSSGCPCPLLWDTVEQLLPKHQHVPGSQLSPGDSPHPRGVQGVWGGCEPLVLGSQFCLQGVFLCLENKTASQSMGAELQHQ